MLAKHSIDPSLKLLGMISPGSTMRKCCNAIDLSTSNEYADASLRFTNRSRKGSLEVRLAILAM